MNIISKSSPQQITRTTAPLRRFIPNLFTDFFDDFQTPGLYAGPLLSESFDSKIRLDVSEKPKEFLVRAEIPGAKKQDIHVSIEGGFVNITAQTSSEKEERSADERIIRSECYYGSSSRGFQLPSEIAREKVKASYENGVLQLTLPKANGGPSHEIEIK
jgi:HSP20 family protein